MFCRPWPHHNPHEQTVCQIIWQTYHAINLHHGNREIWLTPNCITRSIIPLYGSACINQALLELCLIGLDLIQYHLSVCPLLQVYAMHSHLSAMCGTVHLAHRIQRLRQEGFWAREHHSGRKLWQRINKEHRDIRQLNIAGTWNHYRR